MKHIRQAGLVAEDMNILVDLVEKETIVKMINQSTCISEYKGDLTRSRLLQFLQYDISKVRTKPPVKNFYKEANNEILYIHAVLEEVDAKYEEKLKSKKLRDLRSLFAKVNLSNNELRAIPILLKCMDIEYSNNITFMLENELYIRSRIDKESKGISESEIIENAEKYDNIIVNKLLEDIRNLEEKIKIKNNTILTLDEINKELKLELEYQDTEIGYFQELTTEDYAKIINDLGNHSSKIKEKFKGLLKEFEEAGDNTVDQLYELWMKWTDDEVTVMDSVLKKSIYGEKIKRSDINDLEDISENIMNRHLLSRIVLHLIYRRMASQYFEEVLKD